MSEKDVRTKILEARSIIDAFFRSRAGLANTVSFLQEERYKLQKKIERATGDENGIMWKAYVDEIDELLDKVGISRKIHMEETPAEGEVLFSVVKYPDTIAFCNVLVPSEPCFYLSPNEVKSLVEIIANNPSEEEWEDVLMKLWEVLDVGEQKGEFYLWRERLMRIKDPGKRRKAERMLSDLYALMFTSEEGA